MMWLLQRRRSARGRGVAFVWARSDDDRGQAVLLLLPVVALAALVALAAVRAGGTVVSRGRAQAAADAAALAAVDGGVAAASRLATANGATVTRVSFVGTDVLVSVVVDGVSATARATNGP